MPKRNPRRAIRPDAMPPRPIAEGAHPFSTSGGGFDFERRVATRWAACLLQERLTELGGQVVEIRPQTGPPGFDDLEVTVEVAGNISRTVHVQCRHRQPFTKSDRKFVKLIGQANDVVSGDEAAFANGNRRLAIAVGRDSPGHTSMMDLCNLARDAKHYADLEDAVHLQKGVVQQRWEHCLHAAEEHDMGPEQAFRVLAGIEVQSYDLMGENSPGRVEMVDRLADLWEPRNIGSAGTLVQAFQAHIAEIAAKGVGRINRDSLTSNLSDCLPDKLGANTRAAKLIRLMRVPQERIATSLESLGLDAGEAAEVADHVLRIQTSVTPADPVTAVSGNMGVGKTTELLRIYRRATQEALETPNAPIPVFLPASEIVNRSLRAAISDHLAGLGDPAKTGVHLVVDGLDESGLRMANLVSDFSALRTVWPGSTLIVGTRPQRDMANVPMAMIEPLSPEDATDLMARICPNAPRVEWMRDADSEALRHPLFAILSAVERRKAGSRGSTARDLIRLAGERAISDMRGSPEAAYGLLARIACRVVDTGGQPASLAHLAPTPAEQSQLMDSPIVQTTNETATFHLAVLTEWFATHALLADPDKLEEIVSNPSQAHRWRYVLAQAMRTGSAQQVDRIMSTLLARAPATAGWVCEESSSHLDSESPKPLMAADAQTAGTRLLNAATAVCATWRIPGAWWSEAERMPTLGFRLPADGDGWITTAWRRPVGDSAAQAIPLAPHIEYGDTSNSWSRWMITGQSSGEAWPWHWARKLIRQDIEDCFRDRQLLRHIKPCWPELAWDYAHQIINRSMLYQPAAVRREELEAVVAQHRSHYSEYQDVHFSGWRLREGEAFVADLQRLGQDEIQPPWPTADTTGRWNWEWWTPERLCDRLQQATKGALDAYQSIVDLHLPAMASELDVYLLLPARIVGVVKPAEPGQADTGFHGHSYRWHIEPLPDDCTQNEAEWRLVETDSQVYDAEQTPVKSLDAKVRQLRGNDIAERVSLWAYSDDAEVFSSTPAGHLALRLLHSNLSRHNWITGVSPRSSGDYSTRPHYP